MQKLITPYLGKKQTVTKQSFLLVFIILLASVSFAQNQHISVSLKETSIKAALMQVQKLGNVKITYGQDLNKYADVKVTYSGSNVTVSEAITHILKNTNLRAVNVDGYLVIEEKPSAAVPAPKKDLTNSQSQQPGSITGIVIDHRNQPLTGASIHIAGSTQATQSALDGSYTLNLKPGTYTLEISFTSYQPQRITDIVVKANSNTSLTIAMKPEQNTLSQVVVTSGYKKASISGLLTQQKNAAELSDGIAAEQIARSPDNNAADALGRVTGLTTIDKKYVVVRGMGERWNETAIDGITQPSTEPLKKSFSFDLIPASIIDNIVVSKTPTPDMNANFTGGYVQVNTKDIPDQDFFNVSLGTSYNDLSTFKAQLGRKNGSTDFLGFDDGRRKLPKRDQIETMLELGNNPTDNPKLYEQSRLFKNDNFTTYTSTAPLGLNVKLAGGKLYRFGKDNTSKFGFTAAVSFKNQQETEQIDFISRGGWQNAIGPNVEEKEPGHKYYNTGNNYNFNTTWGGLLNMGLQVGKHRFAFRNIYSHIFNQDFTRIRGYNKDQTNFGNDIPSIEEVNRPLFTDFIQNKLEGRHQLGNIKAEWGIARTEISREQRDVTYLGYSNVMVNGEVIDYPATNTSISTNRFPFSRGNYAYRGKDLNWNASLAYPFKINSAKQLFKIGYFGATKTGMQEYFEAGLFNLTNNLPREFQYATAAELLRPENYRKDGLAWLPTMGGNSKYEGKVYQHSPFAMFDNRFGKFRLVWGVRAEYFKYEEISNPNDGRYGPNDAPLPKEKKWQYLPSANFTYSPWTDFNFRIAYAKTVSRPQFAERNRFSYYDPVYSAYVWNMPVVSSVTDGYDFKAEWYPEPGDILSAGVYYRNIADPIELYNAYSATNKSEFTLKNSKRAQIYGLEIDIQKNFGFIHEQLKYLRFSGNLSLNNSKVDAYSRTSIDENGNPIELDEAGKPVSKEVVYRDNRPLYGQSPYSYNIGLAYITERWGINALYNKSGRKYMLVGSAMRFSELQNPYGKVDAQLSYRFLKNRNLELVLNISNLFNEKLLFYNNHDSYGFDAEVKNENNKMDPRLDNPTFYTKHIVLKPGKSDNYDKGDQVTYQSQSGRRFSLSINYKF
ncbi:TonB-dependent receptor [Pseudoflavitalea sp. G-6-1-2]|uniref:TonB-dependent receptor n=1 Tax=Pseudoflavitalea sp. G-6-1-2 TaxID=2728841 RepID=UPI001469BB51|nr:TonB-dependent receptor [Pseudoflavitalea sp. G-6-1-2]NML21392.1 TonB-dependent receptor [Pseudoflavitalea sp. G-6-1-2]